MIRIQRTKLTPLGPCRGFALELAFVTDLTDDEFEAFADRFYQALEPLRLVNFAARVSERVIEVDTSDVLGNVLGNDPTHLIRDVQTALHAAAPGVDTTGLGLAT